MRRFRFSITDFRIRLSTTTEPPPPTVPSGRIRPLSARADQPISVHTNTSSTLTPRSPPTSTSFLAASSRVLSSLSSSSRTSLVWYSCFAHGRLDPASRSRQWVTRDSQAVTEQGPLRLAGGASCRCRDGFDGDEGPTSLRQLPKEEGTLSLLVGCHPRLHIVRRALHALYIYRMRAA